MTGKNILLVEDDLSLRFAIESFFAGFADYSVRAVGNFEAAKKEFGKRKYHLVLTDVKMPGGSGYDLLEFIREVQKDVPVILMTGYGSIEQAVSAMKQGAFDFLVKPFQLSALETTVKAALEYTPNVFTAEENNRNVIEHPDGTSVIKSNNKVFVTNNLKIKAMIESLKKVAASKATVLLQGESGTGKEILAGMIHDFSPRREKPFVAINCAALPDSLLESELFGHEKGSFTGAVQRQIGKFELSDGGTIFLDEISEMSLNMQTKLLRVLQECEIYRIGGNKPISLNLRVITSTNRDLYQYMKQGHFREDLYYRINVVPINVVPLRERGDDLLALTHYFIKEFSESHARPPLVLDDYARHQIINYPWYGNVRELRNAIERAVLVGSFDNIVPSSPIAAADTIARVSGQMDSASHMSSYKDMTLDQIEKRVILETLRDLKGNRTHTATKLGISLRTLRNKLKIYRLEEDKILGGIDIGADENYAEE